MKTIHPAIAEHVMEENERLRGLLQQVVDCQSEHYGDGCGLHLFMITLVGRIKDALSQQAEPEGTTSDKYRAELYDEVWEKARSMGYGNVTDALIELERMKAEPVPAQTVPVAQALRKMMTELEEIALIQPDCSKTELILKAVEALATRPAQTEQQPGAHRECRVIGFRPGMGEVTFYVEDGVPQWMNIGETIYVSDAAPIAQTAPQPEQSGLADALQLAANRLDRLGLNQPPHSREYHEARDWAEEAIIALRDYRAALSDQGGEA